MSQTPLNPVPQLEDLLESHVEVILLRNGGQYIKSLDAIKQGTAADPSLSFADDSGIYQSAVGNVNIAIAGVNKFDFNATGEAITGTLSATGNINTSAGVYEVAGIQVVGAQQGNVVNVVDTIAIGGNTGATSNSLHLVGNTSTGDQSAVIMDDFASVRLSITELQTQLNALLAALRTHGLLA